MNQTVAPPFRAKESVELTEETINDLIEKYSWIVYLKANNYYSLSSSKDDIVQEGLIGLYKAIINFDSKYGVSFLSFASVCIERKIISYLEGENRKKHQALNSYTSIYTSVKDDETDMVLIELLDGGFEDPSSFLLEKEMYEQTKKLLRKKLTKLEYSVVWLRIAGYHYDEVADLMNVSHKTVDNALYRTRSKSAEFKDKMNLIINGVEEV